MSFTTWLRALAGLTLAVVASVAYGLQKGNRATLRLSDHADPRIATRSGVWNSSVMVVAGAWILCACEFLYRSVWTSLPCTQSAEYREVAAGEEGEGVDGNKGPGYPNLDGGTGRVKRDEWPTSLAWSGLSAAFVCALVASLSYAEDGTIEVWALSACIPGLLPIILLSPSIVEAMQWAHIKARTTCLLVSTSALSSIGLVASALYNQNHTPSATQASVSLSAALLPAVMQIALSVRAPKLVASASPAADRTFPWLWWSTLAALGIHTAYVWSL